MKRVGRLIAPIAGFLIERIRAEIVSGVGLLSPPRLMKRFVVQDSPIHAQMRTTGFQFC